MRSPTPIPPRSTPRSHSRSTRRWRRVSSRGTRHIPAADFFTGLWETSLEPDEILTAVRFPVWGGRCGFAIEEFARRHGDFAIAGAAVAVELDADDRVTRCGIGLLGLGSTPLRGSAAEEAIVGRPVGDIAADEIGRLAMGGLDDDPGRPAGVGRLPRQGRRHDGGPRLDELRRTEARDA